MNKEIDKIIRRDDDDVDVEGEGDEEGKKKEKGTNIHRLMKNRLQKLTAKTDQEYGSFVLVHNHCSNYLNARGRRVCAAFMDLPSRKKWPIYYKLITRPICIEDIFVRAVSFRLDFRVVTVPRRKRLNEKNIRPSRTSWMMSNLCSQMPWSLMKINPKFGRMQSQ